MNFENRYKNGEYETSNPTWGEEDSYWKAVMIKNIVKKNSINPSQIIEVGCGSGAILENLQVEFGKTNFIGYDISPQAIKLAQSRGNKIIFFEKDFLIDKSNIFTDLLLVIDVIEHVQDYYYFLNSIKSRSKFFVFHIPLDISCRTILKPHVNLQQRTSVGHIHYFSEENVWWMLNDCGYIINDWHYTKPTIDVVRPKSIKQAVKKCLRNISYFISKKWSVKIWGGYSLLILAENNE
ncbi:MAG: class I SAM-dependent methyltransferase [Ferruginibacter sp.]|nr:class I SAM-dependent methyltransferase [Ferruginibacter sp.]